MAVFRAQADTGLAREACRRVGLYTYIVTIHIILNLICLSLGMYLLLSSCYPTTRPHSRTHLYNKLLGSSRYLEIYSHTIKALDLNNIIFFIIYLVTLSTLWALASKPFVGF